MYEAIKISESTDGAPYLVEGAILICPQGSTPSKLAVTPHQIKLTEKNQGNKTDCVAGTHIKPFGICKVTGKECFPEIVGSWMNTHDSTNIDGSESITMNSFLVCKKKALIQPLTCGQGMVSPLGAEKVNPATGAPKEDAQNKNHWCWLTCAIIMSRDKMGRDGLAKKIMNAVNEFANKLKEEGKYYYSTADGWKTDGNGILGENAGQTENGYYYLDDIQNYINSIYGTENNDPVPQEDRNQAIIAMTGEALEMGGWYDNDGKFNDDFFENIKKSNEEKKKKKEEEDKNNINKETEGEGEETEEKKGRRG